MSFTPEQAREMIERTEKARKKKPVVFHCEPNPKIVTAGEITDQEIKTYNEIHGKCDHKFVDSNHCLKCGWVPPANSIMEMMKQGAAVENNILGSLRDSTITGSVRLVLDFWASEGVPRPMIEFKFCAYRKFRFDFAWDVPHFVYLECQGGLFVSGRHTRGAALLKEHEKLNLATEFGWRPLFCIPDDLLTLKLTQTIKRALKI